MKKGIHPVQKVCKVKCACGNEFEVKSTKDEIQLESCNKCHSFYTGKFKTVKGADGNYYTIALTAHKAAPTGYKE